jgi:hypothetical protein
MARINPWAAEYAAPEPEPVTRTLSAPGAPDLVLTLRPLDEFTTEAAFAQAAEWEAVHVKGKGGAKPLPLAVPGGCPPLSRNILDAIAFLCQMQVPEAGEEPYSLLDWLGFAKQQKLRPLWRQAIAFTNEVNKAAETAAPNPPATATSASST